MDEAVREDDRLGPVVDDLIEIATTNEACAYALGRFLGWLQDETNARGHYELSDLVTDLVSAIGFTE